MLDEIRNKIEIFKNKNINYDEEELKYLNWIEEVFKYKDAIKMLTKVDRIVILHHLGYDYTQAQIVDEKLMKEINKKYIYIDIDRL